MPFVIHLRHWNGFIPHFLFPIKALISYNSASHTGWEKSSQITTGNNLIPYIIPHVLQLLSLPQVLAFPFHTAPCCCTSPTYPWVQQVSLSSCTWDWELLIDSLLTMQILGTELVATATLEGGPAGTALFLFLAQSCALVCYFSIPIGAYTHGSPKVTHS